MGANSAETVAAERRKALMEGFRRSEEYAVLLDYIEGRERDAVQRLGGVPRAEIIDPYRAIYLLGVLEGIRMVGHAPDDIIQLAEYRA